MKLFIIIIGFVAVLFGQDIAFEAFYIDDNENQKKAKMVIGEVFDSKMMIKPIGSIESSSFLFFKSNKINMNHRKILKGKNKNLYIKFIFVDNKNNIPYEPIVCFLDDKWFFDESIKKFYQRDKKINPNENVKLLESRMPFKIKLIFKKARTIINGKILDKNNKPINNVTIEIIKATSSDGPEKVGVGDKKISNLKGEFTFEKLFLSNNPKLEIRLLFVKKGLMPKFMKLSINNQKENNLTINLYESEDDTVIPKTYCYEHRQVYNKICGECTCPEGEKWYPEIKKCDDKCEEGKDPIFTSCENNDDCQRELQSCVYKITAPRTTSQITSPTNKTVKISLINDTNLIKKKMEVYYGEWIDEDELDQITIDNYQTDDRLYKIGKMKNGVLEVIHAPPDLTYCAEPDKKSKICNVFNFDAQYYVDGIPASFFFVDDSNDDEIYYYSLQNTYASGAIDFTNIQIIDIKLELDDGKLEFSNLQEYNKKAKKSTYESNYELNSKNNTNSNCNIHMEAIDTFIDDCNWNDGISYIIDSQLFNHCSQDLFDSENIYKVTKIFGKNFLSTSDEEIMNYIKSTGPNNQQDKSKISILLGLYEFFYIQNLINSESWKKISICDVSEYYFLKSSVFNKLFINLLILETERKFKAQKEHVIDPIIFYPDNKINSKFSIADRQNPKDIGDIKDLTLKYYRLYNKYAEEANHYEGCLEIPVDDQIKLLNAYKK